MPGTVEVNMGDKAGYADKSLSQKNEKFYRSPQREYIKEVPYNDGKIKYSLIKEYVNKKGDVAATKSSLLAIRKGDRFIAGKEILDSKIKELKKKEK